MVSIQERYADRDRVWLFFNADRIDALGKALDAYDALVARDPGLHTLKSGIPKELAKAKILGRHLCALCKDVGLMFSESAWVSGGESIHLCPRCWERVWVAPTTPHPEAVHCWLCEGFIPGGEAVVKVDLPAHSACRIVCSGCAAHLRKCRCDEPLSAPGRGLCPGCFVDLRL